MTRGQFIRGSGWGLGAAAVCLLLTLLRWPTGLGAMPFFLAILLITLGLVGLGARCADGAGGVARLALGAGVASGIAGLVSNVVWAMGHEHARGVMNNAMAVMFAGLLVFGLVALRARLMPRGNGLAVLAGIWWPLIVIGGPLYHQLAGRWLEVPFWASFILFSLMAFFLARLGYVLQSDAPPE